MQFLPSYIVKNNVLYPFVVQNEKEDAIAAMWRHVALNSKAPEDQLSAYQNAIEALEVCQYCTGVKAAFSFSDISLTRPRER